MVWLQMPVLQATASLCWWCNEPVGLWGALERTLVLLSESSQERWIEPQPLIASPVNESGFFRFRAEVSGR